LKILIITPRIPYPPFRGDKLKIFNISRILAQNNQVNILSFNENKNQIRYLDELKKYNINIKTVKQTISSSILNVLFALFKNIPFQVAYFSSKKMSNLIKEDLENNNYDVIYFHLIRTIQYFNDTQNSNALKVADFTDAVSLYLQRYVEVLKNPIKKFFFKVELNQIKSYEHTVKKFSTLFICSEVDKKYLQEKLDGLDIQLLRNGVDEKYFIPENLKFEKHRIIFTGNMPYYANYDAAIYFSKEIFPSVIKKYPDSKFYIVGQKPPLKLRRLNSKNIIVTGFVSDIKKEYLLSEINVAPIRFGAGTLNKVIESLALGVPVIATEISIAGLPDNLKKFIFVANNPKEFIEKIFYIFEHPEIRNQLMNECKELIPKILGWEPIVKEFENYLKMQIENKISRS